MSSKCLKLVSILTNSAWCRNTFWLSGTRQATCCCYCVSTGQCYDVHFQAVWNKAGNMLLLLSTAVQVSVVNMTSVSRLLPDLESVQRMSHWPRRGGLSRPVSPHQTTAPGMTPQWNQKQMLHPRLTTKITSWKKRSRKLQWLVPVHVWFIGFNNVIYVLYESD